MSKLNMTEWINEIIQDVYKRQVWFLLVYETLNNRLRLLIISRSYK